MSVQKASAEFRTPLWEILATPLAFGDPVIKIFVVAAMLLSVCVAVSLGQQLVLWCIIETDSDISEFSDVVLPP